LGLVGAFCGGSTYGSFGDLKSIGEDIKMKAKYKIYSHKLYSPKDISKRIGVEVKKIIALLEKRRTASITDISRFHFSPKSLGRKMGNFWFIRGSEVLEINKIFKERKRNEQIKAGIKRVHK